MPAKKKNAVPDGCDTGNGNSKQHAQRGNLPTLNNDTITAEACRAQGLFKTLECLAAEKIHGRQISDAY